MFTRVRPVRENDRDKAPLWLSAVDPIGVSDPIAPPVGRVRTRIAGSLNAAEPGVESATKVASLPSWGAGRVGRVSACGSP
ncbi:MAG TPA: hypothetical protein VHX44_14545, partial [Planctomycetota bacterium]|nr:hypothetical protein [Planctomycetota bacterium]